MPSSSTIPVAPARDSPASSSRRWRLLVAMCTAQLMVILAGYLAARSSGTHGRRRAREDITAGPRA